MSVELGVLMLVTLFAAALALHVAVVRAGCRAMGERMPGIGATLGAVLVAGLASMAAGLTVTCMGGFVVSALSAPVGLLLQLAIGVVVSGWVLSRVLSLPLEKALAIETVWGGVQLGVTLLVGTIAAVAAALGS